MPYCPHCNRDSFEFDEMDIGGTKYQCVQCTTCKAPIGFMPSETVDVANDDFETRVTDVLRVIVSSLQTVSTRLARIEQALQSKR
jgi:hypothetical protein